MPLPPRISDRTLNPEIERLLYQVNVIQQDADGLLWGLSEEQLHWTPRPDQWSVGQCFDHLNVSNTRFLMNFERAIQQSRQAGLLYDGPYRYGFLSRWFFRQMEPPVKRRFKAPAHFQPGERKTLEQLKSEWDRTHSRLHEILRSASGLDLARAKVVSPAASWVKYSVGIGFWIQTAHDRRHLWQARQVRNMAGFPLSTANASAPPPSVSA
jgi:hypothetical protein